MAWQNIFQRLACYASAARTATPTVQGDQTNRKYRGIKVFIDASAATSTPSVVFTIEGKNEITGNYYTILASAAVVGVGVTVLTVFPGAAVAANASANDYLPETWRVKAVHGNSNSLTYRVSALLLP